MYKTSILAKLFPYVPQPQQQPAASPMMAPQMAPQPAPMVMDTAPTPATPPPYAQPVRTPQMPDESTVTFNDQSAINSPGWDRNTLERPTMSDGKPTFTGTPTQIARQQAEYDAENPENKDHGWKGRLKEIAANFLYGMGQAEPGSDWKAALALGGIGAAGGLVNRKWNEQREAMSKIPYLRQKEQFESQQASQQLERDNKIEDNRRLYERDQNDAAYKKAENERKTIADRNRAEYYDRKADQGDLKALRDDELLDLRDKWANENNATARRRLDLVEKEMGLRQQRSVDDRASREKIAGMNEQGRNDRVKLAADYRQKGMDYKAKLDEIAKTSDQARKLQLQQEAAKIQQEAIRLRAQIN